MAVRPPNLELNQRGHVLYFAYGSNMWQPRLHARIGIVRAVAVGRLDDYRLTWHKRSADGSGKCDIAPQADSAVFGVVYDVSHEQMLLLDQDEKGYKRTTTLLLIGALPRSAETYVGEKANVDVSAAPYDWYKELVLAGVKAHGLPSEYVESIGMADAKFDPKPSRAEKNRTQLTWSM
jgi:gamma-glutamylcyclotransferase